MLKISWKIYRETAAFIYKKYGENSKVGILPTNGTFASSIYEKMLRFSAETISLIIEIILIFIISKFRRK